MKVLRGRPRLARGAACALLLAAPGPAPGASDRYFPFRLGDSWTYEWTVEGRQQVPRTSTRTRVFEGTEFVGGGVGYRLVSDDGAYHVWSLTHGVLALHASSEGGRILYYDPPVPLFTPGLRQGEPLVTVNGESGRRWKTTLLGTQEVNVPLGRFADCLRIRLEMESVEFVSDATYSFASGVGLVAWQYELRSGDGRTTEVKIDARLKLARLAGIAVANKSDLARVREAGTVRVSGVDEPGARAILRRAIENRYTWDEKFPGFEGEFEYLEEGRPAERGRFFVDAQLDVRVRGSSEAVRATVAGNISSFLSHRKFNPFDLTHASASFRKGATGAGGEIEILADGDTVGTRYAVLKDQILRVGGSAGRLRFTVDNLAHLRTEDGRSIAVEYTLTYFSNEDGREVSKETMVDAYGKVGAYWLPVGRRSHRTEGGQEAASFELRLTNLH